MTHYANRHHWQLKATNSARTRSSGCTWTTLAMGVDAQSGGKASPLPDDVVKLVARDEETSPTTPGWSLADASLAMKRLRVPFVDRSGGGWQGVKAARASGMYVVLQGDSDRFQDGCSGTFDGDHCIGLPPTGDVWWIDDPICRTRTQETETDVRAYALKLAPTVRYGVFTVPVPLTTGDDMDLFSAGQKLRKFTAGTELYDAPGGRKTGVISAENAAEIVFVVVAQDDTKVWGLIDGGGEGRLMRWVRL